jgi:hypothetical protein
VKSRDRVVVDDDDNDRVDDNTVDDDDRVDDDDGVDDDGDDDDDEVDVGVDGVDDDDDQIGTKIKVDTSKNPHQIALRIQKLQASPMVR